MTRKTLLFSSLTILATALYFFLSPKEDVSFSPDIVSSSLLPNPRWSISEPSPEEEKNLHTILSQKFTFLGDGEQVFSFQSEDEKYVLKFFKMRRYMFSLKDYLCPHFAAKRCRKLNSVFTGYKNGFQDLRKETGLIWVHLAKTATFNQMITVIDLDGKECHIDADSTEFVIQEKAELLCQRFSRLYKEGKVSEIEQAINSFYAFIQSRMDRGYTDRDKAIMYNYGFVEDRPIQVDLGRLYKRRDRKIRPKGKQLEHVRQQIELWKLKTGH